MLGAADGAGRVGRHHLADDKPIEQHADGGKLHLHGRRGKPALQFLDVGGYVERLHVAELAYAVGFAPGGKFSGRFRIGLPGIRIADIDGEEFPYTLGG